MMRTPNGSTPTAGTHRPADARAVLTELFWAGVRAVAPGPALRTALEHSHARFAHRTWIIAVGKAAHPMAAAAVEALADRGAAPAGGLIIAPAASPTPHDALESLVGDHPLPGPASLAAGTRLGEIVARVPAGDAVWVLLSGGASSLAAAPTPDIAPEELHALFALLLGSGLDIATMNVVRKRIARWGAGRLAIALRAARVRQFVISDVIDDDLAAIGSGPCVPDPTTAADVQARLAAVGLWDRAPAGLRRHLLAVQHDPLRETPKPGNPAFHHVETQIIASNRIALEAIAAHAGRLGYTPHVARHPLRGEASDAGSEIAAALTRACASPAALRSNQGEGPCLIWGGETTVTLTDVEGPGAGGRCQELALAVARELARHPQRRSRPWLLAAGTDGRDGPTDAAGAIVTEGTWAAVARGGRDPAVDLKRHDAYAALDTAGALFRTGLTGTNVMDVVVGIATP